MSFCPNSSYLSFSPSRRWRIELSAIVSLSLVDSGTKIRKAEGRTKFIWFCRGEVSTAQPKYEKPRAEPNLFGFAEAKYLRRQPKYEKPRAEPNLFGFAEAGICGAAADCGNPRRGAGRRSTEKYLFAGIVPAGRMYDLCREDLRINFHTMRTGIFYGSTTGMTESLAAKIAARTGVAQTDVRNVADASADEAEGYDLLLLGSSTWGLRRIAGRLVRFSRCTETEGVVWQARGAVRLRRQRLPPIRSAMRWPKSATGWKRRAAPSSERWTLRSTTVALRVSAATEGHRAGGRRRGVGGGQRRPHGEVDRRRRILK